MQLICPYCKKTMKLALGMEGHQLKCPACGGAFQAPAGPSSGPNTGFSPPESAHAQTNPGGAEQNPFATNFQPTPYQQPARFPNQIPGKATAASILLTVGGGMATLTALGVLLGTFCIWFFAFYSLIAGILALVFGIQSFNSPRGMAGNMKTAAIMLIITIISFDIISMVIGIITLIMISDPEAQHHFS